MADTLEKKWWNSEKGSAHNDIFDEVERLEALHKDRESRFLEFYRSYTGRDVQGLKPGELTWWSEGEDERPFLNYNLTASAIDTSFARHCVHRTRIQVVTQGGNWNQAQRARLMQRFIDGLMMAVDGHTQMDNQFIDGAIFGSGFVRVSEDGDPICIEWQFAPEFLLDEQSCVGGDPRNVYQRKYLPTESIIEKWDVKDEMGQNTIRNAAAAMGSGNITQNMVSVVIATRRAAKPGMKKPDGRRVICCKGITLSDEVWESDDFDFVKWDWKRAPGLYFGIGAAEELRAFQCEIKESLGRNQRAMAFASKLIIFNPVGSEVLHEHILSDKDCIEIPYNGPSEPKFTVPDPVSPQQMQYPFLLATQGYNQVGVSQMEAQAERPEGNMSGRALRTIKEIATGRSAMRDRSREKAYEKVVTLALRLIRDKAKRGGENGNTEVLWKSGRSFEKIDWKKVELPEEDYQIQCFPTAWLPLEPSARMQTIQDWISMGWLDPDLGAQLMDMPDIDRVQSIRLAALNHIQWMLDQILYDGKNLDPDPMMDLDLGITWARSTYLWAQMHGAPEDRQMAIIDWIEAAKNLKRANALAMASEEAELQEQLQREQQKRLGMGAGGTPGAPGLMSPTGQMPGGAPVLPAGPSPTAQPAMRPPSPVPGPEGGVMPNAG